jgi:hypothetical protein
MAARKKTKKKITLSEFKAWLEGADDFHGKDWAPTKEQWKMIRERIDSIVEPEPEIREVVKEVPSQQPQQARPPMPPPPKEVPELPPNIPPPPPVPGGVPVGEVIKGSALPVDSGPAVPTPMPQPSTEAPGGRSTTPNIDTSDGKYKSGFI